MTRTTHYARTSALPAIAAALALSSTPSFAQEAQPTEPAPVTQTAPPPVTDATPATTDTSPAATSAETAAPAPTSTVKTTRTHTVRAVKTPAPKAKTATTVARTTVTRQAVAPAPAPAAPATSEPAAPNSQSAVAPVVDMTAKPANQPTAAKRTNGSDETLPIAGGALALLALGGAAFAVSRRRRREEAWHGDWEDGPTVEHETAVAAPAAVEAHHDHIVHDEQPEVVAPSAFSWGATAPGTQDSDSEDDRLPGETWVQRAYRGPSANNPSVSLKNRLRRAAFFDKRERDVAAGLAEPVDPNAGLPDAMADEQEREFA